MMSFLVIVMRFKTIKKLIAHKQINDIHTRAKLIYVLSKTLDQIRILKNSDITFNRRKEIESILKACQLRLVKNDQDGFLDQIDAFEEWRKIIISERKRTDDLVNAFKIKTSLNASNASNDDESKEKRIDVLVDAFYVKSSINAFNALNASNDDESNGKSKNVSTG